MADRRFAVTISFPNDYQYYYYDGFLKFIEKSIQFTSDTCNNGGLV